MSSKSKSKTVNTTNITTETMDLTNADIEDGAVVGDGNTVTFSDQGAIDAGRDVAIAGIDGNLRTTRRAFDFARDVQDEVVGAISKANERVSKVARGGAKDAIDAVSEASKPASERTARTSTIAIAAVGVAALFFARG